MVPVAGFLNFYPLRAISSASADFAKAERALGPLLRVWPCSSGV